MKKQKILIIEDDADIAALEKDFLEINGFEVEIENDGAKGAARLCAEHDFSLVLLDLMLPGKDGISVCREVRGKTDIPILMVTARVEDSDKVRGLGLGADDYIIKPFSPAELTARVKSHLARYERLTSNSSKKDAQTNLDYGRLRINKETHRVYVNDAEIILANKEYELLCFLASHPDIVFSKETLHEKIWEDYIYGDIKTVAVHINRLREKIETNPAQPEHIQTVWGAGYRFSAAASPNSAQ